MQCEDCDGFKSMAVEHLMNSYEYEGVLPKEVAVAYRNAECLYSEQDVELALTHMATEIRCKLIGSNPLILCVMNGALLTTAQLSIRLSIPLQLDYLHVSRYHGETEGSEVNWHSEPRTPLADRTVLIVDDILDEGHTLMAIQDYCYEQGAAQVFSAVLVQKRHNRRHPQVMADFIALTVDDHYVFGYGMDYKNHLRNLPGIFALR
jgi:hypoxanthine phosphoribosyltransferase